MRFDVETIATECNMFWIRISCFRASSGHTTTNFSLYSQFSPHPDPEYNPELHFMQLLPDNTERVWFDIQEQIHRRYRKGEWNNPSAQISLPYSSSKQV